MPGFLASRFSAAAATVALSVTAVVLATLIPASASPAPSPHPVVLGNNSGAAIPGKYFVKLKDNTSVRNHGLAARSNSLASGHSGKLARVLEGAVHGFSAMMNPEEAQKLAAEPDVEYVQQEHTYQAQTTQFSPPSWGVNRLDQRTGTDDSYNYIGSAGAGVHAYIIDSGIRKNHPDINGRADEVGFNAIDGSTNTDDCTGHGTYNAGIVGGTQYGVAKKVSLVAVKIFDCSGSTDSEDPIIAGFNWVIAHAKKPAVINLSIGSICTDGGVPAPCPGGDSQGIIDAEKAAIAAGITVVTSAGNEDANACFNPVGSAGGTINVGATDASDRIWNDLPGVGSNWGGCVDIFAPGSNIVSIGGIRHPDPNDPNEVDPDPRTASGTSAAAPHVTGAVALLLGTPKFATATPAEIAAELDAQSTRGIIQGLPDELSPNKLLFVRPTSPRTGTTVALARNANGKLSIFGTNADSSTTTSTDLGGHMFTGTQTDTPSLTWPTQWTPSHGQGYASVAAGTDGSGTSKMVLVGLTAEDEVFHRQQAAANFQTWLGQSQLDGSLTSSTVAPNADRRLMLIGADKHGGLRYRSQRIAGDDTSWGPSGTISFLGDAQTVTAAPDSLGRINIFIADTHGVIWYTRQTAANADTWQGITPLADPEHRLMNEISVVRNGEGKLDLFGTSADGFVRHRVETVPGSDGNFGSWSDLSFKVAFHLSAATDVHNQIVVASVDYAGDTWQSTQIPGTNTFTGWSMISGLSLRP
ncbi:S8 family serine peptidase [Kribbella sp. NBC_00359]|uniref:S8 family serine peptidase n=1 Tax=Kribbella sp. NBC_00359 TaxID=2975966 RepID=UPI002E25145D